MVDELRVRALLDRLAHEIDALRRPAARDRDDLLADDDLLAAVKHRFIAIDGYARVDDTRVVDILRERVADLAAYRRSLARAAGG